MQKLTELIMLSNLYNFQLFASNIEGNISHQKLQNCCVAKKLMSNTFSVKFRTFWRAFLWKHSVYWIIILFLASSDSDKHYVNEAKSVNKDSPIICNFAQLLSLTQLRWFHLFWQLGPHTWRYDTTTHSN